MLSWYFSNAIHFYSVLYFWAQIQSRNYFKFSSSLLCIEMTKRELSRKQNLKIRHYKKKHLKILKHCFFFLGGGVVHYSLKFTFRGVLEPNYRE